MQDREREQLLREAMIAVRGVISTAEEDSERPGFHFRPPARWMNDPNGPISHQGWHHIFYQHNPYGDGWGNMHWGHARSRDLIHWEHLPIALWPSKSQREDHIYSGSTWRRADGTPMIFYTSIGGRPPEQWAALPRDPSDPELKEWIKIAKPMATAKTYAPAVIDEWRDPFLFDLGDLHVMLVGGRHEGKGIVSVFATESPLLEDWVFKGFLFRHPTLDLIECPNFLKIGDKWVLLISWAGRIEAFVGTLDEEALEFKSERTSVVALGSYASQIEAGEIPIFTSWINVGGAVGWTGCLALPCEISLDSEDHVTLRPVKALEKLRRKQSLIQDREIRGALDLSAEVSGRQLELVIDIDPGTAARIELELGVDQQGGAGHKVSYDAASRTLTTPRGSAVIRASEQLKLHIFFDRVVMDVFADGGRFSHCLGLPRQPYGQGVLVRAIGGTARIRRLEAHQMESARFDLSKFQ